MGYKISRKQLLCLRCSIFKADFFKIVIILPMEESVLPPSPPVFHCHCETGPPALNISGQPGHWAASAGELGRAFIRSMRVQKSPFDLLLLFLSGSKNPVRQWERLTYFYLIVFRSSTSPLFHGSLSSLCLTIHRLATLIWSGDI